MKNIQNSSAKTTSQLHGLTFTVFFIVESVINELLYPILEEHLSKPLFLAISAIIAAGLYGTIYAIVSKIYNTILIKKETKLRKLIIHLVQVFFRKDY